MHAALPAWPALPPWEPVPGLAPEDVRYTATQFPLRKMPDGRILLDACTDGATVRGRLWNRADDPALAQLKAAWPHVPRAVLAPYRADVILAVWRATEWWPIQKIADAQEQAWSLYHQNNGILKPRREQWLT